MNDACEIPVQPLPVSEERTGSFGVICIEVLSVNRMVHNRCLSRSIADAAWSRFAQCLSYKAEEAGRKLARVNAAYTSQDCHRCGHRQTKELSDRVHRCSCCGLKILGLGLQSLGLPQEAPA